MRVAVVNSMAPFVWGGAEELAFHLVRNLQVFGHEAELYRIPFAWDPYDGIPLEIARNKALRLSEFDRVISMKFPVYLLDADHHTTWLVHQYRQAYDLWDSPYCNIPHTAAGEAVRALIVAHDNAALRRRKRLFTISQEISRRLERDNGISAPPLRAPLNDPELFIGGEYQPYILAAGRINDAKRQKLLIEAMVHLGSSARLIVAGPPEREEDARALREMVSRKGLDQQIKLDLRFLTRRELADYVNNSRAVAYLPYQEDSYGYVTMEAFEAAKPVITAVDAGELLEIVHHDRTGLVSAAEPRALADSMSFYLERESVAADHGHAARDLWRRTGINWRDNIERLLGVEQC